MHNYKVILTYGTFFVIADYYSIVNEKYQFWKNKKIVVQYPVNEVKGVEIEPPSILSPM